MILDDYYLTDVNDVCPSENQMMSETECQKIGNLKTLYRVEDVASYPTGCYLMYPQNNAIFWNKNQTGEPNKNAKAICKSGNETFIQFFFITRKSQ